MTNAAPAPLRHGARWTARQLMMLAWLLGVTFIFLLVNPPIWGSSFIRERIPLLYRVQQLAITAFHRPTRF